MITISLNNARKHPMNAPIPNHVFGDMSSLKADAPKVETSQLQHLLAQNDGLAKSVLERIGTLESRLANVLLKPRTAETSESKAIPVGETPLGSALLQHNDCLLQMLSRLTDLELRIGL